MKKILFLLVVALVLTSCSKQEEAWVKPEKNSVFYEIFVASFYDSDGDDMGDLKGVIEKLDYIQKDLGATGIWLMPISPSPSYHKYDVKDYKAIDPDYGTMEDFDALVLEMNNRGMDLILDLVLNHSSREHPWFLEAVKEKRQDDCSALCDYYNFSDKPMPGYREISQGLYYESVFSDTMPDLNLDSTDVINEIEDITKFWLDKGVSGFRLDATTHFYAEDLNRNVEFLSWFNDYAKSIDPEVILVGEAWTGDSIVQKMYASGISFFNFGLSQNTGRLVKDIKRKDGLGLAQYMAQYQRTIEEINPGAVDSIFYSNHDHGRSASYFANNLKRQKLAASIYLLLPGNVYIYYGEEIGMKGSGKDENKRLPMVWCSDSGLTRKPSGADYPSGIDNSVMEDLKNKDSLLNHYANVVKVRNAHPEIMRGLGKPIDMGNKELFAMELNGTIVVHNLGDEKHLLPNNYEIIDSSLGGTLGNEGVYIESMASVIIRAK